MRRDSTRLLFSCEWVVVLCRLSQEGWKKRKTQSTFCCRAGRLERIRPYLNGSLLFYIFPLFFSHHYVPPPNTYAHGLTSYTTPSHPLPDFIIFSGERVAIFSLFRIKTDTYVINRGLSCVIQPPAPGFSHPIPRTTSKYLSQRPPHRKSFPILDWSPDIRGERPI